MVNVALNTAYGTGFDTELTKEDVWGKYNHEKGVLEDEGMVVARGKDTVCPVFGDKLPYKSVTVVCDESQYEEVLYWLDYVHGGGCVSDTRELDGGRIAIRSNYMCW